MATTSRPNSGKGEICARPRQWLRARGQEGVMEISGKVAVVSGGGSGIGRAAVLALIERKAKVVVADIDEDGGRHTVVLAAEKGGSAVFARCNVTKTEDLAAAFASAVKHFGQ